MVWTTSASTRNVAVSDQLSAEMRRVRLSSERVLGSILVNGQGPAMQETRTSRNWADSGASSDKDATAARQRRSGEHGDLPLQGTFPSLVASKVLTTVPTSAVEPTLTV